VTFMMEVARTSEEGLELSLKQTGAPDVALTYLGKLCLPRVLNRRVDV